MCVALHKCMHTDCMCTCVVDAIHIGVGKCFIVRGPNLFSVESGTCA